MSSGLTIRLTSSWKFQITLELLQQGERRLPPPHLVSPVLGWKGASARPLLGGGSGTLSSKQEEFQIGPGYLWVDAVDYIISRDKNSPVMRTPPPQLWASVGSGVQERHCFQNNPLPGSPRSMLAFIWGSFFFNTFKPINPGPLNFLPIVSCHFSQVYVMVCTSLDKFFSTTCCFVFPIRYLNVIKFLFFAYCS